MSSKKSYEKPSAQDLSGFSIATGGCDSGLGVPNRCVDFGHNNATSCIAGTNPGFPPGTCASTGQYALDCVSGTAAGV